MHPKGTSFGAPAVVPELQLVARIFIPSGFQREISTQFAYFWMDTD